MYGFSNVFSLNLEHSFNIGHLVYIFRGVRLSPNCVFIENLKFISPFYNIFIHLYFIFHSLQFPTDSVAILRLSFWFVACSTSKFPFSLFYCHINVCFYFFAFGLKVTPLTKSTLFHWKSRLKRFPAWRIPLPMFFIRFIK